MSSNDDWIEKVRSVREEEVGRNVREERVGHTEIYYAQLEVRRRRRIEWDCFVFFLFSSYIVIRREEMPDI